MIVVEYTYPRLRLHRAQPHRLGSGVNTRTEVGWFGAVGTVSFLVDTAVFMTASMTMLEGWPVAAKTVAVVTATVVGYLGNRRWSFRGRRGRSRSGEMVRYGVVCAAGLALNAVPLWLSHHALGLHTPLVPPAAEHTADLVSAQLVGTSVALVWRWWAFRRWVFPGSTCGTGAT